MNDKQIAAFISVAENGSFSSAARKQYISPQAMLQQIDLLEKEVGVALLSRTRRGVTLTEAGKLFYQGMLRINADVSALLDRVRSAQSQRLRIGLFGSSPMIDTLCRSFSAAYPQIQQDYVMLSPESWLEDLKQIRTEKIDISEHAETPEVYEDGLGFLPLFRCGSCCALLPTHPLASKASISPADLAGMKIGIHARSCVAGLSELIHARAPGAELIDCSKGPFSAYQICSEGGVFLLASNNLEPYRPLRILAFECDLTWSFGIVYKEPPEAHVQLFLQNARKQFSS